ncbi:hypothetical protein XM38_001550 [Halomicronema hongdechloris C2206]|uniref:Cyanoexosortase B system-associated protein n=1 Tax=Halomicronema hongdechloris C2206 TaxID=1641165 RepID=A0A1Z3HG01_9CYAN|nr:cyanoexosortase B system-associated protein [Halomicronema hongdechloris]ASC69229.1 hypothetical protein XM38_001550 [Halomicronema hongdechloris C2206]
MVSAYFPGRLLRRWGKGLLVVILAALVAIAALPHYLNGQWPWASSPRVSVLNDLKALSQGSLTLPAWSTVEHRPLSINGQDWVLYELQPESAIATTEQSVETVLVLLRPQPWHTDQPSVEWVDLQGSQNWTVDSRRSLSFTVPPRSSGQPVAAQVQARFSRGWNNQRTFAVLQWYAWPRGGSASPAGWFWADQYTQWQHRQRLPWVAVSLLIPIKPLGTLQPYESLAQDLGQAIQQQLMVDTFKTWPN